MPATVSRCGRIDAYDHDHDRDETENALDPHVWTSPPLVARMASTTRDALTRLDPEDATDYAANHDAFVADLEALAAVIRAKLAPVAGGRFMVDHPAWGYLAETYDLVQCPIEFEGKTPEPRTLSHADRPSALHRPTTFASSSSNPSSVPRPRGCASVRCRS